MTLNLLQILLQDKKQRSSYVEDRRDILPKIRVFDRAAAVTLCNHRDYSCIILLNIFILASLVLVFHNYEVMKVNIKPFPV